MTGDMVVALARATVDGHPLFGHNSNRPARLPQPLQRTPGRAFTPGETLRTQSLDVPQVRQTYTVLASAPADCWGYDHGVSEHQVATGCVELPPARTAARTGLRGTDLVRLVLERSHSARHGVDLLTDLLERHGQTAAGDAPGPGDHAFLVADPREAFAVETAGSHWVCQEVGEVRAASNVRVVRQDWNRISSGLADHVIAQGLWPADGSKLDFAGALGASPAERAPQLRRWGRATLLLEQQNGHVDAAFVRRLLGDHYENVEPAPADPPLCRHALGPAAQATAVSLVAQLRADPGRLPVAWCAFGPPCSSVYFPLFLDGELPAPFQRGGATSAAEPLWRRVPRLSQRLLYDPERWVLARASFARLQARFDQEAEEFAVEGAALRDRGAAELQRQATLFMQHHLEQFETVYASLQTDRRPARPSERPAAERPQPVPS